MSLGVPMGAFLGAILATLGVLLLAGIRTRMSTVRLILAGAVVSALCTVTHTSWEASGEETVDYSYLYTLSTDAAPAIEKYAGKSGAADYRKQGWYQLYCEANEEALNATGLRTYNVSHAVAKQLLMEDNRE